MASSRAWLLTHVKNGFNLTYTLFKQDRFDVDECHYTSDSTVVYTYVHYKNPVKQNRISEYLDKLQKEKKITLFEIVGYSSISPVRADMPLSEHIGLKMIFEHHLSGNGSCVSCTDGVPGIKRGFFWNWNMMARLKGAVQSKSKRLISFVEELDQEITDKRRDESTIEFLRDQLAEKDAQAKGIRERMQRYQYACHLLRLRMADIDPTIREILISPSYTGDPLMPEEFFADFFDFSQEARIEWPNPHGRRY